MLHPPQAHATDGAWTASDRVERGRKVGDQVVGILDPDRDAHEVVGDAERRLALFGDREVCHRRGRGGERLGAAQRHRQLGDPERVEERERLTLAALEVQREGRPRAGAVAAIDVGLARAILGAIAQQLGKPPDVLTKLRKTLNSLSRFDFGALTSLSFARKWQAKEKKLG